MENLPLDLLAPCVIGGLLARSPADAGEELQVIDFMDVLSDQAMRIADPGSDMVALAGTPPGAAAMSGETPLETLDGRDDAISHSALMDVLAALPATATAMPAAAALSAPPAHEVQSPATAPKPITVDLAPAAPSLSDSVELERQAPELARQAPVSPSNPVSAPAPGATASIPGPIESDAIRATPAANAEPPATPSHAHPDSAAGSTPSTPTRAAIGPGPSLLTNAMPAQRTAPSAMPARIAEGATVPTRGEHAVAAPAAPPSLPDTSGITPPAQVQVQVQVQSSPMGSAPPLPRPVIAAMDSTPSPAPDHGLAGPVERAAVTPVAPLDHDKVSSITLTHEPVLTPTAPPAALDTQSATPQSSGQSALTAPAPSPTPLAALMPALAAPPRAEITPQPAPYTAPMTHVYVESPVHSAGWSNALGERVAWLMDHGQHKARLHIDPEHLGPIDVTLTLKGNEVGIAFSTAQAELRGVLDLALPQLRETLAQGGVQLGSTTVSAGSQGSGQDASGAAARQRGYPPAAAHADAAPASAPPPARASLGLLDTYA